jgi:hypothetical protein
MTTTVRNIIAAEILRVWKRYVFSDRILNLSKMMGV